MLGNIRKIVVVAGCQRSGVLLVGQIIGAHPDTVLLEEQDGAGTWFRAHLAGDANAPELLREVLSRAAGKYRPRQQRIVQATAEAKPAIRHNVTHLVLQVPDLMYQYAALARSDTPVSVVMPVRDPRAVVASMMKFGGIRLVDDHVRAIRNDAALAAEHIDELARLDDGTEPPHARMAAMWRLATSLYGRFLDSGLPTLRIRYEDLVEDTLATCRALSSHVGLPFDRRMTTHDRIFQGLSRDLTERSRPLDRLSIDAWRDRLTPRQEREIVRIAGEQMAALGFEDVARRKRPARARAIPDELVRRPIILTGRGGSGTRLLADIAERVGIFIGNRLNHSGDSLEWLDLIFEMAIEKATAPEPSGAMSAEMRQRLLASRARSILGMGTWQEGQLWGFKLPEAMIVVPELFSAFPDAKLIHLVRHPVDCSLRRTHLTSRTNNRLGEAVLPAAYRWVGLSDAQLRAHEDHMRNAVSWLYQVDGVTRFARRRLSSAQYLELRYEDICNDPHAVIRRLVAFTGAATERVESPGIDAARMRSFRPPDSRVGEVWGLCRHVATTLGYGPVT